MKGYLLRFLFTAWLVSSAQAANFSFTGAQPTSGTGDSLQFSAFFFGYAPNGFYAELAVGANPGLTVATAAHSCVSAFVSYTNSWILVNDDGTGTTSPGTNIPTQNSQCMLAGIGQGTGVTGGVNGQVKVSWNISFTRSYVGSRQIWVYARAAGLNATGWIPVGNWNVTAQSTSGGGTGAPLSPINEPGGFGFNNYTAGGTTTWSECLFLDDVPYRYAGAIINHYTYLPGCKSGGHTHDPCDGSRPDITFAPDGSTVVGKPTLSAVTDFTGCSHVEADMPWYAGTHYIGADSGLIPYPPPNQNQLFAVHDQSPITVGGVFYPVDIGGSPSQGYVKGVPDPTHANYINFFSRVTLVAALQDFAKRYQDSNVSATQLGYPSSCTPPISSPINPRSFIPTRASLEWGGILDTPGFYRLPFLLNGLDSHMSGSEIDIENPAFIVPGCVGQVLAAYLYSAITTGPCTVQSVFGPTRIDSTLWHVACL